MKKQLLLFIAFTFSVAMFHSCGIVFVDKTESLNGTWFGNLEVAPGKELEFEIVISKNEDNTFDAEFGINGEGDIPFDETTVENNKILLKCNEAPFTIKGTINWKNKLIDSEFRQGENVFPLILKRVGTASGNDS
ncbi:hypothetical protein ACFL6P_03220 [Candidatus Latescibacterota bacterium]